MGLWWRQDTGCSLGRLPNLNQPPFTPKLLLSSCSIAPDVGPREWLQLWSKCFFLDLILFISSPTPIHWKTIKTTMTPMKMTMTMMTMMVTMMTMMCMQVVTHPLLRHWPLTLWVQPINTSWARRCVYCRHTATHTLQINIQCPPHPGPPCPPPSQWCPLCPRTSPLGKRSRNSNHLQKSKCVKA